MVAGSRRTHALEKRKAMKRPKQIAEPGVSDYALDDVSDYALDPNNNFPEPNFKGDERRWRLRMDWRAGVGERCNKQRREKRARERREQLRRTKR